MRIKNINEEFIDIEVIRYFTNNDNEYLIYSLNEADEAGYIKLYASKIIQDKACIITDNEEWDLIKQIIKEVVRNNRDGQDLSIIDLDEDKLLDITLQDTRVFKLQGNLVTLLSENKKVLKHAAVLDTNNDLQNEIDNLQQEIDKYKEKISNIKDLLDE